MYNDLFKVGKFTVHGYGLMIGIGIMAAYLVAEYRAKKKDLDSDQIFNLLVCGVLFGFLGAKLLYYITIFDQIMKQPSLLLNLADGFVVYGGIIGGILSIIIYCKIKKISPLKYLDLLIPSVALAQGFGRIGCLLAGCCYGVETDSWLSIVFHHSAFAPNDIPLFPTQIFSSIFDFFNFMILVLIARKNKKPGSIISFYLIFYSIGRFIIEFFRGDLIRGKVGYLSTSQFISLFMLAIGCIMLYLVNKKTDTTGRME